MVINSIKKNNKVIVTANTVDFVDVGTILRTDYDGKARYFKVVEIEASLSDVLHITAENYGYYDKLDKGVDIRKLIGLGLIIVKNEETLEILRKETCFC